MSSPATIRKRSRVLWRLIPRAALLLRTGNSAQFGLSREITRVQHAIT
jgi:hypothetical protein